MTEFEIKEKYLFLKDEIIRKYFNKLNQEQLEAVLSDEDAVLVAACPGAGKTQVIINRIAYLTNFGFIYRSKNIPNALKEESIKQLEQYLNSSEDLNKQKVPECLSVNSISSENIVVITFTKMAAKGMRERYKKISGNKKAPFFGTFHSLFYRILSRYYSEINIISERCAYNVIKSVLENYIDFIKDEEVRCVINDISYYKNKKLFNLEYQTKTDNNVFIKCLDAYETYKSINRLMDFDDIIINCIGIFEENPKLLNSYKTLFKNILVDEFQDCDSGQIHILKLLAKGNKIFAVGDEDQCIYGFRGSRPDCMVEFNKHFSSGIKYFLNKNYRSKSNIVNISKNVIRNNKCRNEKQITEVRLDIGIIKFVCCKTEKEQAEKISELITAIKNEKTDEIKNTAVLFRTNNEYQRIIGAFIKNNIKFNIMDKNYNFFEISFCKDIISYLRYSIDFYDRESFIRIINKPYRYISKTKIEKLKGYKYCRNCFNILMELEEMPLFQLKVLKKLEKTINKISSFSPERAINYIIEKIGYGECIKGIGEEIVKELKSISSDYSTIREFLNFVDNYCNEMTKTFDNHEAVILSTIHGVKGLEFKNVFLINCNKDNMPHINSLTNIEEERRLFYVGITRAIDNLWVLYSETFKGNYCEVSPFVKECGLLNV